MTGAATLYTAVRAIGKNALRSVLATLGITIAVAAVVGVVALGEGVRAKAEDEMEALGTNLLFLNSGGKKSRGVSSGTTGGRSLTWEDGQAILLELGHWAGALAPMLRAQAQVIHGNTNWPTTLIGTTPDYFVARHWQFVAGGDFAAADDAALRKVCVIGYRVAQELFGDSPEAFAAAIGESIRTRGLSCQIAGILKAKGQTGFGGDQDDAVIMPYHTLARRILGGPADAGLYFIVSARSAASAQGLKEQITTLLRQRHKLALDAPDDFSVFNVSEMQEAYKSQMRTLSLLLASVALISLVVGSIGIANVMLVSVTERTREIGIRMAVGATRRDILWQFLVEALVLTALGGAMGVALGSALALMMARTGAWPMLLSWQVAVATLAVTALAGVLAGFYPAFRASRLDPIDALRFE